MLSVIGSPPTDVMAKFGQNFLKCDAKLLVTLLESEYDSARGAWNQRQADLKCALVYNVFASVKELPIHGKSSTFNCLIGPPSQQGQSLWVITKNFGKRLKKMTASTVPLEALTRTVAPNLG
jgi:hypothetical protein